MNRDGTDAASLVPLALLVILTLGSLAATIALWTLGQRIVISPAAAVGLIVAGVGFGLASLLFGRAARRLPSAITTPACSLGLVGVLAVLAFPVVLYQTAPGEAELFTANDVGMSPSFPKKEVQPRRLRIAQLSAAHDDPSLGEAELQIEGLFQSLAELDADVILLQQVWSAAGSENLAQRLGKQLALEVAYARANGSRRLLGFEQGVAVLSRFPLSNPGLIELEPRKHAFARRIVLEVDIVLPNGDPLRVASTRLENEASTIAQAQARDVLNKLSIQDPPRSAFLIGAELNASLESPTLKPFLDDGWMGVEHGDRNHLLRHETENGWRQLWSEQVETGRPDRPAILAALESSGAPTESRWRGSWQPATETGMLDTDLDRISRTVETIGQLDGIESVLVIHDGLLLAERYFRGASRERLQNMKSASKGVLSALVGIAIDQGHLALDDPISDYLPEARSLEDQGKAAITVRHLLAMTSGLESTSFGAYGSWAASRNLVRNALERPLVAAPGTTFAYSTGSTHLLSAVLTAATGESTLNFARKHLFRPLGIEGVVWERDRQGIYLGGNNLAMRPRDMARFGLLYLDRGRWADSQVVPWRWVDESTDASTRGRDGGVAATAISGGSEVMTNAAPTTLRVSGGSTSSSHAPTIWSWWSTPPRCPRDAVGAERSSLRFEKASWKRSGRQAEQGRPPP